jgi:cytochrome b561
MNTAIHWSGLVLIIGAFALGLAIVLISRMDVALWTRS